MDDATIYTLSFSFAPPNQIETAPMTPSSKGLWLVEYNLLPSERMLSFFFELKVRGHKFFAKPPSDQRLNTEKRPIPSFR